MNNVPDQRPAFSIVLVNYKSFDVTVICMDLIKKAVDISTTPVFVVDNNSADESLRYLKSLDWITLIERVPPEGELGFMAHGCALDMALAEVSTDYILLLHTDTFIHNPAIINILLSKCISDEKIAAVGCMEPVHRNFAHILLRLITRGPKYYFRRLKLAAGIKTRPPKLYYEKYMKSFCTLWNAKIIKSHGMTFSMENKIPGYEMQDRLRKLGYKFVAIPPRIMFSFLDHIEKGSPSAMTGNRINSRKIGNYNEIINKTKKSQADQ